MWDFWVKLQTIPSDDYLTAGSMKLEELQDRLGYHFNSTPLLEEALHPAGTRPLQGNKRLALVGDSVLSTSLLDEWYDSENTIGTLNCEIANL
jgi:CBS domain containing-hemolysin-like protein